MGTPLDKMTLRGFKSIRELKDLELKNLNILIGGNGAGKSNFIDVFRLLRAMVDQNLGSYVTMQGGADDFFFNGPKVTPEIMAHFCFGKNEYRFELATTADEKLLIKIEEQKYEKAGWKTIGSSIYESHLPLSKDEEGLFSSFGVGHYVYNAISNWTVYHFHDTSVNAPMRRSEIVEDHKRLRHDASNIAPFLLHMRNNFRHCYQEVLNAVRLVMPFFDDFLLEPVQKGSKEKVKLNWKQKGSDFPMQPYQFSDGSIRFIGLATALLQAEPPSTIIIDEPELGLHPEAIAILAELIHSAAKKTQVIVSTQSPALIDNFSVEDIIVVNRKDGASTFERLQEKDFNVWLESYSVGELWNKNVIVGGPVHE